ncbi:NYN domain-containing protein [Staphylococcus hyicus]|uniref:NYN domain-containing protein n=1 Tax=Staphylococcus hyicus TaxID=1284 RepID=UPI00208E60CE|nr:NYN domain-containing protein [Staphylococcus hyicus]MCO4329138.1 NYN domain-containing protein [Staphylococcus hyicus]MCO4331962.1 NYN domain-containing protein [Staphylococcus hyicus]MCO4334940.1 NYN domain-containing protein [Staphylococcus hyicus]MCO4335327.1 NYN domain-containing protein [Staphylococcus hyicus]UWF56566.1 NYN domain-containing protein [Staphylococcus hyicus]
MIDYYVIIDGYNMIGQSPELSRYAKDNLEEAREQLLIAISNYNAHVKGKVICVFDAYDTETPQTETVYHGVHVIFTKENETADSFIERYVYNIYNKYTTHITVVTSDMSEQHAIFGTGAYRMSSREMWRELKENENHVSQSMSAFEARKPRTRIQLSDDVLSEFEKIRRGQSKKQ